ncbi:MAG: MBL fold metallo-hydrolase [Planctomycetes bacterium]|nr:MBL fold metallo-hydrolase [Planctomycetota bacterium]
MTIEIQFLGAARYVTGSKHLLRINGKKVLLDCGMVQGPRAMANKANSELPEEILDVDAVVLSHAHIDHSGSLPRLVKMGYAGDIYCTHATKDLTEILLYDSAHIQAQDAKYLRKKHRDGFQPPYDEDDVRETVEQLRGKGYNEEFEVIPGVRCEFYDAGHILGSAMVVLRIDDGGRELRIAFTGDHGRKALPVLRSPARLPEVDVLLTESTYGDRLHDPAPDLQAELGKIVNQEMEDGGRILIPAFSVGRTQNVVYFLGNLIAEGAIPKLPIYVDSPLSTKATKILASYPELYDEETRAILASGRRPFLFEGCRYVASVEESKSLNSLRSGIIIAASGMCESGRIIHHLKQSIGHKRDTVLAVGYMADGTLGRRLVDGVKEVRLFGEEFQVRCQVRSMRGLSAHADYKEILENLDHLKKSVKQVFVVHGEEPQALKMAERLHDAGFRDVAVPVHRQKFEL